MVYKLRFGFLFLLLVTLSACGTTTTTPSTPSTPVPVGTETSGETDENGAVTVTLGEGEDRLELRLTIKDIDTDKALPNITVTATALQNGVFVWVYDEAAGYHPIPQFVKYDAFTNKSASKGELEPQFAWVAFLLTLIRVAVAIDTAYSLYQLVDELEIEEFYVSPDVKKACLAVTGGTLINAFEAAPFFKDISKAAKSVNLFFRVLGAPAKIRGVTAINFGFVRKKLFEEHDEFLRDVRFDAAVAVTEQTGLLDKDIVNVCWYVNKDKTFPVLEFTIERGELPFDILSLEFPQIIHPQPFDSKPNQDIIVTWKGANKPPFTFHAKAIRCFVNFECTSFSIPFNGENPMSIGFACRSNRQFVYSDLFVYSVFLSNAEGERTPAVTFSFRCISKDLAPSLQDYIQPFGSHQQLVTLENFSVLQERR